MREREFDSAGFGAVMLYFGLLALFLAGMVLIQPAPLDVSPTHYQAQADPAPAAAADTDLDESLLEIDPIGRNVAAAQPARNDGPGSS
ncbi:MAG: hypothetical protein GF320_17530 [Armatimonadia bacterium]|nr:hypothetical protein [Armatimonadia bacterium]